MPYHVKLWKESPYIPNGIEVLDQPPEWGESLMLDGEYIPFKGMSGIPVNPEHAPSRFKVRVPAARLPDLFGLGPGLGVTDLVRDKVEALEPGVHQFLPAEIAARDGERPERRFWFLHICNRVDAIDPQTSVLRYHEQYNQFYPDGVPDGATPRLVLKNDVIAGMCLWIDRRWGPGGCFMSDAFFEFVSEGQKGEDFFSPPGAFVTGGSRTKLISWEVYTE